MSEDLAKYLRIVKLRGHWYNFNDFPKTLFYRVCKFYIYSRPAIFAAIAVLLANSLRFKEGYGLFDASVTLMVIVLQLCTVTAWWVRSQNQHEDLIQSYNKLVTTYDEPWMADFRRDQMAYIWKICDFIIKFMTVMATGYLATPIVVDTILHYGFDILEKPFFLPHVFNAITDLSSWNMEYYVMTVLGWWFIVEASAITQTQFAEYSLFLAFHIIELRMFKEFLCSEGSDESEPDSKKYKFLRKAIEWHSDLTEFHRDMKAFVGFPCAFLHVFTSLAVTLNAFSALLSPNFTTSMISFFGVVLYGSIGFSYTAIGQLLENEGDDVYVFLNGLPWHSYVPSLRRDLALMIAHARKPIVIDFHGGWQMNLENYMEIMTNAYSLFAMLRTAVVE